MTKATPDLRLRLVFSGECAPGHDPQAVRRAVASALKLDARRTERLFSGKPIVIKAQVDVRHAVRQVARFATLGAVLHAEPMPEPVHRERPVAPPRVPEVRLPPVRSAVVLSRGWVMGCLGLVVLAVLLAGTWMQGDFGSRLGELSGRMFGPPATVAVSAQASETVPTPAAVVASAPVPMPVSVSVSVSVPVPVGNTSDDDDLVKRLSPKAAQDYERQYLPAKSHRAFAVSEAGAHVWVSDFATEDLAREAVLQRCMQLPGGSPCRVVDFNGQQLE